MPINAMHVGRRGVTSCGCTTAYGVEARQLVALDAFRALPLVQRCTVCARLEGVAA